MTTTTHKTRLADHTSGVRLRVDQIEAVEQLCALDPEMDMSTAVRRGLDMFLASQADFFSGRTALQTNPATSVQTFRSLSAALTRNTTGHDGSKSRKQR